MGLEELLQATRTVAGGRPLRLAVAGTGVLDAPLRRLADELGLSACVSFLGRVADDQLPDWYCAADLVVMPTVAYEGFGLVTAEALACGTPVVGTTVGATPELLGPLEPRLLSPAADPEVLAATIEGALDLVDPELRKRCREHAVAHLSWDAAIAAWERALEEAAGHTELLEGTARGPSKQPSRSKFVKGPKREPSQTVYDPPVQTAIARGRTSG